MALIRYWFTVKDSSAGGVGVADATPVWTKYKSQVDHTNVTPQPTFTNLGDGDFEFFWDDTTVPTYGRIDQDSRLTLESDRYLTGECGFATPIQPADITNIAGAVAAAVPNLTAIVNGLWNELVAGHTTAGSFAAELLAALTATNGIATAVAALPSASAIATAVSAPTAAAIKNAILDELLAGHTTVASVGAALNKLIVALPESYPANGQPGTFDQLLYWMFAVLTNISETGQVIDVRKLDGTTSAGHITLNTGNTARVRTA